MVFPDEPRVTVVVLNHNGLEDTLRCLDSLRQISYPHVSAVLVDNGSTIDPEQQALTHCDRLTVIKTGTNLGYAGGNNRGIEHALDRGADCVLILNNDTIVASSIVSALVEAFRSDPVLGIVGPVINFMDEPDAVMTDGVRFNPGPGTEFFQRLRIPLQPGIRTAVSVDIVNGCCMMVRSDVFRAVGLFDEQLFIVHEEADLCLRALEAGFGCAVLSEALVWHKGSSSFDRSGRQLQRYFDTRNLLHLLRRHSGRAVGSRGRIISFWHYGRYAFYRYAIEVEMGKPLAARAVAEGIWDALMGRKGPYFQRRRPGALLVRALFAAGHAVSRAKARNRGNTNTVGSTS
jgi:GT2 family glycosyltransferase